MANPPCEPGDYRPECYDDPAPGTGTGNQCPEGSGTHWDAAQGTCVPDSQNGNNGGCPPGEERNPAGHCWPIPRGPSTDPWVGPEGGDYGQFSMPKWQPFNYNFDFGDAPPFTARRFQAPNPEDILKDPSYKWRLDQSLEALQNSAASKGVARTGNTAKGLVDYAGNSASQEYENAFDRSYKIFQADYQGDLDEYKPKLITYQTNAAGKQRAQELSALDLWRKYVADLQWDQFLLSQDA